jgi:F5/8 type C domain
VLRVHSSPEHRVDTDSGTQNGRTTVVRAEESMVRRIPALVVAAFAAGLCSCTLLFDVGALDSAREGPLGGADSSDTGSAPPIPDETGLDAGDEGDDVFVDLRDATVDLDAPSQAIDSSEDAADGVGTRPDATDGSEEVGRMYDASRDASSDGPVDAPHEAAPPFDGASCTAMPLTLSPTAVASSTRTQNLANMAVDTILSTRWESTQQADEPGTTPLPPQWLYIDFGARVSVTRVRIDWQAACAQVYALQVSDDASTWVTLTNGNVTNGAAAGSLGAPTDWSNDVDTTGLSGAGRYLRVYCTQRCLPMYGYSIWEMQVFGHGVSSCSLP